MLEVSPVSPANAYRELHQAGTIPYELRRRSFSKLLTTAAAWLLRVSVGSKPQVQDKDQDENPETRVHVQPSCRFLTLLLGAGPDGGSTGRL